MTEKKRNTYGLTQRDMAAIWFIFEGYPEVKMVYLFGSRAKGNYRPGSDIDLAIMNEGVSAKKLAKLKSDFEDSNLPYNVDLVDFNQLENRGFIDHIKRVGIPFFKRSELVSSD